MKAKLFIIIGLLCHLMAFGVVKHTVQVVVTDTVRGRVDTLWITGDVIMINDTTIIELIEEHASGGAIGGTATLNRLAVGSGTNTLQGEDSLLWQNGGLELTGNLTVDGDIIIAQFKTFTLPDAYIYIGEDDAGSMEWIDNGDFDGYCLKFEDEGDSTCMGHQFDDFKFISTGKYSFKTDNNFSITTLSDDSLLRINEPETKIFNNLTVDGDSAIFAGYIRCDSIYTLKAAVWADYVWLYSYKTPSLYNEIQYAKKHNTLEPLKEHSQNLGKRQERIIESLERLYIQVFKNFKLVYLLVLGLVIWNIILTFRKR